jgi:autotransporter-associated beta strand protein
VALAASAQAEDWSPLWSTTTLSQARYGLAATSAGDKVFFGGGYNSGSLSNVVDIFDAATLTHTTTSLSEASDELAATSAGGKVFFGGGRRDPEIGVNTVVDIFDAATLSRTTKSLSQARQDLSATAAGGKVFFGGGYAGSSVSNVVDIFDAATLTRTTTSLSQGRTQLAAASAGGKVFFGGGNFIGGYDGTYSNVVDVFDATLLTHTTASLSQDRYFLSATSAGGKVFFGGGWNGTASSVVDIFDAATLTLTTTSLSQARVDLVATSAGGKVFFAGGWNDSASDVVDIFDTASGTWSTAQLSQARYWLSATSVGNRVFFGGGYTGSDYSNVVDIYTLQNYGTITSTQAWTLVDNTSVGGRMLLNGGSLGLDGYNLAVGSMAGVAPIALGTHTLTAGSDDTSSLYSGALSGHGGLTKVGAGTMTLSATSSYDGTTRISAGALKVTGDIGTSNAVIDGGTLQGTGRVGAITGTSGHLHPGGSPGILQSGNVTLSPGFQFDVTLNGHTAGTDYSQLDVTGTVDLGGATLGVTVGYGPPPYSGTGPHDYQYIIKNDGTDPVIGQFDGLAQMSEFDLVYDGITYRAIISYQGDYDAGTMTGGNDVVVALPEPATLALAAFGGLALLRYRRARRA